MKPKRGRKQLFELGMGPSHHFVALLLAMGRGPQEAATRGNISYETVFRWSRHPQFQELIEKYKNELIQKIKEEGFDGMSFLKDTQIESLGAKPTRSDGLRAREIEAKIQGEFSPEKREIEFKDSLKKKSDRELEKLLNSPVLDDNTKETNNRGDTEKEI